MSEVMISNDFENFNQLINNFKRGEVLKMLKSGIWKQVPEEASFLYVERLFALRSEDIADWLFKNVKDITPEMLKMDFSSDANKHYVCQTLEKHYKKFDLNSEKTAESVFYLACEVDSVYVLKNMMSQGKIQSAAKDLGKYSAKVLSTLPYAKKFLSDDDIVNIYLDACTTKNYNEKVNWLVESLQDFTIKNSESKDIKNILSERVKKNKYANNKSGSSMKSRDRQVLQKLNKIEKEQEEITREKNKKKTFKIVIIIIIIVVVLGVGFLIGYNEGLFSSSKITTEETSDTEEAADEEEGESDTEESADEDESESDTETAEEDTTLESESE